MTTTNKWIFRGQIASGYNKSMTVPASSSSGSSVATSPKAIRAARWRFGIAVALVLGLALVNLAVGVLASALGNAAARDLVGGTGSGHITVLAAGGVFLALGLIALVGRWPGAFWLAAALFIGVTFKQVVDVARQSDENTLVNTAGLLLRLIVFVPLIAGGAGALARLRSGQVRASTSDNR